MAKPPPGPIYCVATFYIATQQPIVTRGVGLASGQGAVLAQTRTDDLHPGTLPPPLVDAAAVDRRAARTARGADAPHRADRLRLEPRRAAHVHLCAAETRACAGARGRAPRLYPVGDELRSRRRLVDLGGALRFRAAAARADGGEQSEDLFQLVPA